MHNSAAMLEVTRDVAEFAVIESPSPWGLEGSAQQNQENALVLGSVTLVTR